MIFPYQSIISAAPDGDDFIVICRPEIPVLVGGPKGAAVQIGLVDTGSDNTILPKSIADELGIVLQSAASPPASVFGGHEVRLAYGDVTFTLKSGTESLSWKTRAYFFDFPAAADETVVLGHSGFLDFFTAEFDGKLGTLVLTPNDELPIAP
jgi:hypothetical protein